MTRTSIILIATLTLTVAAPRITVAQTKIAVVNIPDVSDKYRKTGDLERRFESIRQQANKERQAIRDRIELTQRSLQEEVKPGSDAYRARLKELATLEAELKWFTEVEGQRIEQGLAQSLREIFDDIHTAIETIATQRGLDIVVASDSLPEEGPGDPGQVRQQILMQKVLYWSPKTDITQEVISQLNANYKGPATSGGGGGGPAPTAEGRR
jgi:Skp family chaperone for outer membrane proteins